MRKAGMDAICSLNQYLPSITAGSAAAGFFLVPDYPGVVAAGVTVCIVCVCAVVRRCDPGDSRRTVRDTHPCSVLSARRYEIWSVLAYAAVAGCLELCLGAHARHTLLFRDAGAYTGIPESAVEWMDVRVLSDATVSGSGYTLFPARLETVGVRSEMEASAAGTIRVVGRHDDSPLWGETVRVYGTPERQPLGSQEVYFVFAQGIERTRTFTPSTLSLRGSLRTRWVQRVSERDPEGTGLLTALISGVRSNLDSHRQEAFVRSGTIHVLALSGMHLGLLIALVGGSGVFLLGPIRGFWCGVGATVLAVWILGPRPSLTRAALLFGLGGAALLSDRRTPAVNVLGLVFLCMICANPADALSLGFQLSFLSVWGIMTIGTELNRRWTGTVPRGLRQALSAAVSAQIATAPVSLYTFGRLYPVGIPASIVVIPMVTVLVWIGLVLVLVPDIEPVLFLLDAVIGRVSVLIFDTVELFGVCPPVVIESAAGRAFVLVVFTGVILCLYYPRYESQLSPGDTLCSGGPRAAAEETVGSELPHQRGCKIRHT
jgi:competence protein ComEC